MLKPASIDDVNKAPRNFYRAFLAQARLERHAEETPPHHFFDKKLRAAEQDTPMGQSPHPSRLIVNHTITCNNLQLGFANLHGPVIYRKL